MKNELFLALTQLAAERNLDQSIVVSAVKEAIASAYRKDPASKGQDISVEVDSETGDVIVKTILNVKEQENIIDEINTKYVVSLVVKILPVLLKGKVSKIKLITLANKI